MRLIISQEQSWFSGLWRLAFFSLQNVQLSGQILFCPDVTAGGFQKLFQALLLQKVIST